MKTIEAVVPNRNVLSTIEQLRGLDVDDVVVESVRVFKPNVHQTMVYRGCTYHQDFVTESKLRFAVSDQNAPQAETIIGQIGHN